jgi:hypothetical protein
MMMMMMTMNSFGDSSDSFWRVAATSYTYVARLKKYMKKSVWSLLLAASGCGWSPIHAELLDVLRIASTESSSSSAY